MLKLFLLLIPASAILGQASKIANAVSQAAKDKTSIKLLETRLIVFRNALWLAEPALTSLLDTTKALKENLAIPEATVNGKPNSPQWVPEEDYGSTENYDESQRALEERLKEAKPEKVLLEIEDAIKQMLKSIEKVKTMKDEKFYDLLKQKQKNESSNRKFARAREATKKAEAMHEKAANHAATKDKRQYF